MKKKLLYTIFFLSLFLYSYSKEHIQCSLTFSPVWETQKKILHNFSPSTEQLTEKYAPYLQNSIWLTLSSHPEYQLEALLTAFKERICEDLIKTNYHPYIYAYYHFVSLDLHFLQTSIIPYQRHLYD